MGNDNHLVALFEFLIWGALGSAIFIVSLKAATGRINLHGLLNSETGRSGTSASRVQLLFLTLVAAFGYLGTVVQWLTDAQTSGAVDKLSRLPEVPPEVLAALAGGSGFYLAIKGLLSGGWLSRLRGE